MRDIEELFAALGRSPFRARFRLGANELRYLEKNGLRTILSHATDFIVRRLAPADPPNDGRQTPMSGHPVFIAQHATATCCRGCLAKWHKIPKGKVLTTDERSHVIEVIARWLSESSSKHSETGAEQPDLDLPLE